MPTTQDEYFAEAVVQEGLVPKDAVRGFLAEIERAEGLGAAPSLDVVLVKKGFMSREQADAILMGLARIPKTIGGFELIEEIGRGKMGPVYRARQTAMGRLVALKVLSPRLAEDPAHKERFIKEARAVAGLNHPHVIQGYDVGEANGHYYFAMEYVDGESVEAKLDRLGKIGEAEALKIIEQVCGALSHAQAVAKIVHGDISPRSILITRNGAAKVAGLGLASAVGEADTARRGGPRYMSPERIAASHDIDAGSDIYSLGATLFHMVTGAPPFVGAAPEETVSMPLDAEPASPRDVNPALSVAVCRLLGVMMAKSKDDRYQTPDELLEDVRLVRQGMLPRRRLGPRSADRGTERAPVRTSGSKDRSGLFVVVALLALLAAGGALVAIRPAAAPPTHIEEDGGSEVAPNIGEQEMKTSSIPGKTPERVEAKDRETVADRRKRAKAVFYELKRAAGKLAAAEHYAAAIEVMEGYPEGLRFEEWGEAVRAEIAKLRRKLRVRVAKIKEKAEQQAREADYDGAIAALREGLVFGDSAMTQYVHGKIAEYRERREEHRRQEKEVENARARLAFDRLLASVMKLERDHAHDAAAQACDAYAKQHAGKYARRALALKDHEEAAMKTRERARSALQQLVGTEIEIRAHGILLKGKLRKISKKTFAIETEITTITKKLVDIDPDNLVSLAGLTAEDKATILRRAGFFLVVGAYTKAKETIKELGDESILKKWEGRIAERKKLLRGN